MVTFGSFSSTDAIVSRKEKKETSHRHQNITDEDCFKNANCTIISWNRIGFSRAQNVDHIGRCLLAPHFDRNNA